MKVSSFLKMCRRNQLVPHTVTIDDLIVLIKQCITPMTNDEHNYLVERNQLRKVHDEDMNPEGSNREPEPCEPGLLFHEFIFLLALIALSQQTDIVESSKKIESFFIIKLQFNKVPEDFRNYKPFDFHLEKA